MRIGHIFILVGTLVTLIVAGIVLAFALVTYDAVDKAVLSAVKGELDYIKTSIEKIVDVTVAPAKAARKMLLANNWTIGNLPATMQPIDQEQTQLQNLTGAFEVFVTTLDAQPDLISFCYQTGKSSYDPTLWFDFGSIAGPPTTVEVPDGIENATIISGVFPPWNLVAEEIAARGVTGESWQIETAMVNDTENGGWMSVASYADEFTGETTSLMTYSLPMIIDPATGECTCGLNIDISVDGLTALLKTIATKGNRLFLIDVRKTYLYDGAFIASSMPETQLPQYDPDTEETFFPTQTPNSEVNRLVQRVFDEYGGSIEHVRSSSHDAIITDYEDSVVAVAHVFAAGNLHWIVVSSIPNEYYYGSTQKTLGATVGAAVGALVLVAACFVAVHLSLARPIVKMLESMQNIASLNEGALEKDEPFLTELRPVHQELSRLDLAVQSFSRYVPKDVVQGLLATSSLCSLEMNPVYCCILFSDVVSFTNLCESVEPAVLNNLLTLYFESLTGIIMDHAGVIDKFIGDAIMALFNSPRQVEKPEALAALCALQMQRATTSGPLLAAFDEQGVAPATRIGLAAGEVLAGNVGSKMRMSYTVFGDPVNCSSRLEGFAKYMGVRCLLSEDIAAAAVRDAGLCCRLLGRVMLQGKGVAIFMYEPLGAVDSMSSIEVRKSGNNNNNNNNAEGVDSASLSESNTYTIMSEEVELGGTATHRTHHLKAKRLAARENSDTRSRSGGADSHSTTFFGNKVSSVSHFQNVTSAARKDCPVSPSQRQYAKYFSRAAKYFTMSEFAKCLELLNRIHLGVMNSSLNNNVGKLLLAETVTAATGIKEEEGSSAVYNFSREGSAEMKYYYQPQHHQHSPEQEEDQHNINNNNVLEVQEISPTESGAFSPVASEDHHQNHPHQPAVDVVLSTTSPSHHHHAVVAAPTSNQATPPIRISSKDQQHRSSQINMPNRTSGFLSGGSTDGNHHYHVQQSCPGIINFTFDDFIVNLQKSGGPMKADVPWILLQELCSEYIEHPPGEEFLGAIIAKGKK